MIHLNTRKTFKSRASAWRSGAWTVLNTTYTEIVFDTEMFDGRGEHDTSNGRFTADEDGYYMVAFSAGLQNLGDGKKIIVQLLSSRDGGLATGRTTVGGTDWIAQGSSIITKLLAGDYISVFIYHNHGGTLTGISASEVTFMSVHRLS